MGIWGLQMALPDFYEVGKDIKDRLEKLENFLNELETALQELITKNGGSIPPKEEKNGQN